MIACLQAWMNTMLTVLASALLLSGPKRPPLGFIEEFDNVGGVTSNGQTAGANLEAQGWYFQNNSSPRGTVDWFQAATTQIPPKSGTGYMAANAANVLNYGAVSNWMLTPVIQTSQGVIFDILFWTRTTPGSLRPDRLEVRMSTNGASTNVGTTPTDVGDFTILLGSINPNLLVGGYPTTWTFYDYSFTGTGGSGRVAFRYCYKGGGTNGTNGLRVGIDNLLIHP